MNKNPKTLSTLFRLVLGVAMLMVVAPHAALPASAGVGPGTIAYVRYNATTGDEIRLVEPDGSNDRHLWGANQPPYDLQQITALAWNPASTELAFASRHEEACSMYTSDIYAIHHDGSGYRRVTAPPACNAKGGLPTGTVTVTIYNYTSNSGPFIAYFEGAPGPKSFVLAPYSATDITFTDVADYGDKKQWAVVVFGQYRYFSVTANADVIAGQSVTTTTPLSMISSYTKWGFYYPSWNSDGSQINSLFGGTTPYTIPSSNTTPGNIGSYLFNIQPVDMPLWIEWLTRAPAGPRQDQVLYSAWAYDNNNYLDSYIFLGTVGSTSPGNPILNIGQQSGQTLLGLAWLPDSSGFVYSMTEGFNRYSNMFLYTFADQKVTRLTEGDSGYTRKLSVSPDGTQIVFEYQAEGDYMDLYLDLDLWVMDNEGFRLLAEDARAPAWSPSALPEPIVYDHFTFLPMVRK